MEIHRWFACAFCLTETVFDGKATIYQERPGDPLYCAACPPDKRNAWFGREQRRRAQLAAEEAAHGH